MASFHTFALAVNHKFIEMAKTEVFFVDLNPDELYQHYLNSFPEGTNPIYRVNRAHDCSCCRGFIKNIGKIISVKSGEIDTVWNIETSSISGTHYEVVAKAMHDFIVSKAKDKITGVARFTESMYGAEQTHESHENGVHTWNHFFASVPAGLRKASGTESSLKDSAIQVFTRGLKEIKVEALNEIIDLIDSNSLYRGEEHRRAVTEFLGHLLEYQGLDATHKKLYPYKCSESKSLRFRNAVIGTLAVDLSEGVDLETAVRSFESKVAPENYKRPTALITQGMVQKAMDKLAELGVEASLERRLAKPSDMSVNHLLWVSSSSKKELTEGWRDAVMRVAVTDKKPRSSDTMSIERFLNEIAPNAERIEVFVSNVNTKNLAVLTAPVHADAPLIFKWNNPYAWSYTGNITDSIREKVKKAGGKIDAKLRFSLEWFNRDDLDLHVYAPGGRHIYFGNKAGILDVDMNAGVEQRRDPVENMAFTLPKDGLYKVRVNQFRQREREDYGFVVEIASGESIQQYSYNKPVQETVHIGEFEVKGGVIVESRINSNLIGKGISKKVWGIDTESYHDVNMIVLSPNHWDDNAVGNKHLFFIVKNCQTDMPARGIYNEFLRNSFDEHRKVFEVIGSKTKCGVEPGHLAGLGFSSTRGDTVKVRVDGSRVYTISF